ncbi:MAG: DUF4112 domain-containing protein [Planctomycetaceae bacterium]
MPGRPVSATLHEGPLPSSSPGNVSVDALEQLARLMDSQFEIPGLGIRFGVDALLGLIPGLGDFAGGIVTLYILVAAGRLGASRITIARMALNIVIDILLGAAPFLGDVLDVAYKANNRNVALLQRDFNADQAGQRSARRADTLFVGGILGGLLLLLAAVASLTAYWTWLLLKLLQIA